MQTQQSAGVPAMEWSWPLFVRITRYDLGWSKACVGWHERLHPEHPKPANAVVSVVAASVVPTASATADGSTKATGVARVAAKVAAVGSKATPVAAISTPAVKAAAPPTRVTVAAVAPAATPAAIAAPAVVATPVTAVATTAKTAPNSSSKTPAKTSPGLGLPQFLVMLEVPGGQVCLKLQRSVARSHFHNGVGV